MEEIYELRAEKFSS